LVAVLRLQALVVGACMWLVHVLVHVLVVYVDGDMVGLVAAAQVLMLTCVNANMRHTSCCQDTDRVGRGQRQRWQGLWWIGGCWHRQRWPYSQTNPPSAIQRSRCQSLTTRFLSRYRAILEQATAPLLSGRVTSALAVRASGGVMQHGPSCIVSKVSSEKYFYPIMM
jgi:hypothetical protein